MTPGRILATMACLRPSDRVNILGAEVPGELRGNDVPGAAIRAEPVQQYQRRSIRGTADVAGQPDAVDRDLEPIGQPRDTTIRAASPRTCLILRCPGRSCNAPYAGRGRPERSRCCPLKVSTWLLTMGSHLLLRRLAIVLVFADALDKLL
jgi:hypothetical protein